jgi:hypothetical protein
VTGDGAVLPPGLLKEGLTVAGRQMDDLALGGLGQLLGHRRFQKVSFGNLALEVG